MKKLWILVIVIILFSCISPIEESDPKYKELKTAYHEYVENDVYSVEKLHKLINEATLYNISATVKITSNGRMFSGVIIDNENNDYFVLTISYEKDNEFIITDYKNIKHIGSVEYTNINSGVTIIKFSSTTKYFITKINDSIIFPNELVVTSGYINFNLNNLKFGLITNVDEDEMTLSNLENYFSPGAPVFNNNLKLIGIQKELQNGEIIIYKLDSTYKDFWRDLND
jgi:hypothetical protein